MPFSSALRSNYYPVLKVEAPSPSVPVEAPSPSVRSLRGKRGLHHGLSDRGFPKYASGSNFRPAAVIIVVVYVHSGNHNNSHGNTNSNGNTWK